MLVSVKKIILPCILSIYLVGNDFETSKYINISDDKKSITINNDYILDINNLKENAIEGFKDLNSILLMGSLSLDKTIALVVASSGLNRIIIMDYLSLHVMFSYDVRGGNVTGLYWSPNHDKLMITLIDASGKKNVLIKDINGEIISLRTLFPNTNNIPSDITLPSWINNEEVSFQNIPGVVSVGQTTSNLSKRMILENKSSSRKEHKYSFRNKSLIQ